MSETTTFPKMTKTVRFLSIGEAADLLGVSVPTVRMYENQGLIIPLRRDSKHRRFAQSDIDRIRCIREMINKEKVSIEGIKRLLALIPCWKIKNCPEPIRTSCPAFEQHKEPCWSASGKTWRCKNTECRLCPVYTDFASCCTLKATIAKFTLEEPSAKTISQEQS